MDPALAGVDSIVTAKNASSEGPTYARKVNHMCHYATDEELDWIYRHARTLRPSSMVVMLGVGPGVFLLAMKEARHKLMAFVVDISQFAALVYLKDAGWSDNVVAHMGDSTIAGKVWLGGPVGFLIVDTDHTEETTEAEIEAWLPHVVPGGLIFFHDYDATGTWFEEQEQYPGVKRAVDRLMSEYELVTRVGTAIVYRK